MRMIPENQLHLLEKGSLCCQDVEDIFVDYTDGDLIPTVKELIDSHIEKCAACREFKSEYLATIALAKQLPQPVLTAGAQSRLRAALNKRLGLEL